MRERGEEDNFLRTLSDIEEVEESKVEILKQNIRTYLSEYISQEEINVVLEYLETRDTDNFWSSLRGYLIEA